ncbi:uncharacterized protein LOC112602333 [Melanaphis sacchari]|uniref:uncharacterized protein LOC112602333 n=1 Tax=Melanaphis sacchari TaxID=742174 RepID=UPI000DC14286|nr:uncharacterized protein LOC112602333 [Melanaphis sacchari]
MIFIDAHNYSTINVSHLIIIIIVVHEYFVPPTNCWVPRAIDVYHSEEDTNTFNWTDDEDDEDDETDDLPPVQVDDIVSAGKMAAFFEKLNSLRQRHREDRSKLADYSLQRPFGLNPVGMESLNEAVAAMDYTGIEVGNRGVFETLDRSATSIATSGKEAVTVVANKEYYYEAQTTKTIVNGYLLDANRSRILQMDAVVGYLHMGLRSAKCLWHQYREAVTEQESLAARQQFNSFVRFWTLTVAVSVIVLWSAFGYFHELFCFCVIAPPVEYAKDVNRYLMMVPPHVVVTNKGKMFRYQPTAEERFLWESAKRIANFKI